MKQFKNLIIPYNQPCFQFFHNDKEFAIYAWQEDENDSSIYSACLAVPQQNSGGVWEPHNIMTDLTSDTEESNIKKYMESIFIPKVNKYLIDNYGISDDGDYPLGGKGIEQFAWIVKNALSYSDGKVIMSDF